MLGFAWTQGPSRMTRLQNYYTMWIVLHLYGNKWERPFCMEISSFSRVVRFGPVARPFYFSYWYLVWASAFSSNIALADFLFLLHLYPQKLHPQKFWRLLVNLIQLKLAETSRTLSCCPSELLSFCMKWIEAVQLFSAATAMIPSTYIFPSQSCFMLL